MRYTEYFTGTLPYFGRTFLRINYIDITKSTYVRSLTVTEIIAKECLKNERCYTFIGYQIHIKTRRNMQLV